MSSFYMEVIFYYTIHKFLAIEYNEEKYINYKQYKINVICNLF